jgi:hypothetical protein
VPFADRSSRPPLAKTAIGPAGAFGALLCSAVEDPATARGLALAYATLDTRHRLQIIDAVLNDAQHEGIGASAVLASLLTVEEDPEVARRIADAMSAAGEVGLNTTLLTRTWLAGDEQDGGVVIVRPLHGAFVEVLALAWNQQSGITHAHFEPLAHHEDSPAQIAELPVHLRFEEIPVGFAVDAVTSVLWGHRQRTGELPPCAQRFADLLWIERTDSPKGCR